GVGGGPAVRRHRGAGRRGGRRGGGRDGVRQRAAGEDRRRLARGGSPQPGRLPRRVGRPSRGPGAAPGRGAGGAWARGGAPAVWARRGAPAVRARRGAPAVRARRGAAGACADAVVSALRRSAPVPTPPATVPVRRCRITSTDIGDDQE